MKIKCVCPACEYLIRFNGIVPEKMFDVGFCILIIRSHS